MRSKPKIIDILKLLFPIAFALSRCLRNWRAESNLELQLGEIAATRSSKWKRIRLLKFDFHFPFSASRSRLACMPTSSSSLSLITPSP